MKLTRGRLKAVPTRLYLHSGGTANGQSGDGTLSQEVPGSSGRITTSMIRTIRSLPWWQIDAPEILAWRNI